MRVIVAQLVSLFSKCTFDTKKQEFLLVDKLWIEKMRYHIYCMEYTFGHKIEKRLVDMWIVFVDKLCIRAG